MAKKFKFKLKKLTKKQKSKILIYSFLILLCLSLILGWRYFLLRKQESDFINYSVIHRNDVVLYTNNVYSQLQRKDFEGAQESIYEIEYSLEQLSDLGVTIPDFEHRIVGSNNEFIGIGEDIVKYAEELIITKSNQRAVELIDQLNNLNESLILEQESIL
jgi:hypothetical protein